MPPGSRGRPAPSPAHDPKLLQRYLQQKMERHVQAARQRIEIKVQASLEGTRQRLEASLMSRYQQLLSRAGFELSEAEPPAAAPSAAQAAAPQAAAPQVASDLATTADPDQGTQPAAAPPDRFVIRY